MLLSHVLKTPAEVERGSPLFLDLVEDPRIMHDPEGFLAAYLEGLRARLRALGSGRVWRGDTWHWDLNASGHIACPGFIDMHAHSGLVILAEPRQEPKVHQGITTELIGHRRQLVRAVCE